jgi:hypothetical protein
LAAGCPGAAGRRGALGLAGAGAAAGFAGAGGAAAAAFFTVRIALVAGGLAGLPPEPLLPFSSSWRIRDASPSLMELLWLFTASPSFSAASSTSLFSRPKSRDSS